MRLLLLLVTIALLLLLYILRVPSTEHEQTSARLSSSTSDGTVRRTATTTISSNSRPGQGPGQGTSRLFLPALRTCRRGGGLCGPLSALMHRGTPNTANCVEYCALFPRLHGNLKCGGCGFYLPTLPPSIDDRNMTNTSNATRLNEPYNITLDLRNVPPSEAAVFVNASLRWQSIVTNGLVDTDTAKFAPLAASPSINCTYPSVIDDLYICIAFGTIDGVSGVLGRAGPLRSRIDTGLPVVGSMLIDGADLATLKADGDFISTIVHEMGHVLGLGTLWDNQGIQGSPLRGCPYTGSYANREYQALTRCSTASVPTEQEGDTGTACGHWDEDCLVDELMTGFIDGPAALSRITIASLQDLGYAVNYSMADAYTLNDVGQRCTCRPPRPPSLLGRPRQIRRTKESLPRIPETRQQSWTEMKHGETRQLGLGSSRSSSSSSSSTRSSTGSASKTSSRQVQRQPRRLSAAAHQMAMEYGQQVLAERASTAAASARVGFAKEDDSTTIYVGDKVLSVLVQDGDALYGVVVRRP